MIFKLNKVKYFMEIGYSLEVTTVDIIISNHPKELMVYIKPGSIYNQFKWGNTITTLPSQDQNLLYEAIFNDYSIILCNCQASINFGGRSIKIQPVSLFRQLIYYISLEYIRDPIVLIDDVTVLHKLKFCIKRFFLRKNFNKN